MVSVTLLTVEAASSSLILHIDEAFTMRVPKVRRVRRAYMDLVLCEGIRDLAALSTIFLSPSPTPRRMAHLVREDAGRKA